MKKSKLDRSKFWVTWAPVGFGITVYCLFYPDFAAPIGFVWGIGLGGKVGGFDVYGSYVLPWARRQGVRSIINEKILEQYKVVRSFDGSKEGGAAFMKATGYRYLKDAGIWFKRRKPGRKP